MHMKKTNFERYRDIAPKNRENRRNREYTGNKEITEYKKYAEYIVNRNYMEIR